MLVLVEPSSGIICYVMYANPIYALWATSVGLVGKRVQVGVPGHGWVGLTLNT